MPPRTWRHRIEDILEGIARIEKYTVGMDQRAFRLNDMVVDAVIRNLEIIGEAARHVPPEVLTRYPDLPWAEMRGMRNLLMHEYFGVDVATIWDTVRFDLPPLAEQLTTILKEME